MKLDRYELIDRIAVGGMAEIYLARATGIEGFEKLVVLKRILPQYARNSDFVAMFLDEARISATLQHPNIAQVHDIGQYGDSYFFTMEYIRGEDVRGILKAALKARKRVPIDCALTIIAGAAAGLHAAHDKRGIDGTPLEIVHRDVSPSNVLVSYDGGVKLVDFGVAKAAQRQTETQAGTLKGKVSYMSPEQCRGKRLDRRSDIFALGILMYELTTHRRLFKGESEYEIMNKIVAEDVEGPSITYGKYPAALEKILMKALARDRDARYATAQEMQIDLEEFARKHGMVLSSVTLGSYMREMFIDRMKEEEARIRSRPRTEETGVESATPDEPTGDSVIVEIVADPDDEAGAIVEVEESQRSATPVVPPTRVSSDRPRRWPAAMLAALVAGGAVWFFTRPPAPEAAAPPIAAPAPVPTATEPAPVVAPTLPEPAPAAVEDRADETEVAAADETDEPATTAEEPEAAEPAPAAEPPRRARTTKRAKRSKPKAKPRAKKKQPRSPPAPKPAPSPTRDWSLDSPLPPPTR